MKKSLIKSNLELFYKQNAEEIDSLEQLLADGKDEEYLEIAEHLELTFLNTFDVAQGLAFDIIQGLANNNWDSLANFGVYDDGESADKDIVMHDVKNGLQVYDYTDAEKVWKKTPEILKTFEQVCNSLNTLNQENLDRLLQTLQKTGDTFPLNGGKICCPRKYLANVKKVNVKIPNSILIIEIKLNSKTNANYRVYGFLYLKLNQIFLIDVYTKTSGQDNADEFFDNFLRKAVNFAKAEHLDLGESLSYNIAEENNMTIFEELNLITEQQELALWNQAREDAFNNTINEELNESPIYKRSYNITKQEIAEQSLEQNRKNFMEYMAKNRTEHESLLRSIVLDRVK